MNKKQKKLILIIFIAAVLLIAFTVGVWLVITAKDRNNSGNSSGDPVRLYGEVKDEIEDKIEIADNLNKLYINKEYDKKKTYENEAGDTCYAYDGDDTKEVIKQIESIYYDAVEDIAIYEIETSKTSKEERLYFCYPENCTVKRLNDKSYSVLHEDEGTKIIKFAETEQVLIATEDEGWQFSIPLVFCEEGNKDMGLK